MNAIPTLATHSGKFHADDVMAYAMLKLALGLDEEGVDHHLLRTRKAEDIARADIVWDVGFVYDPERMRFDHHQADRALRPDGVPYSAAGLVWKNMGSAVARAVLGDIGDIEAVAAAFDQEIVLSIDMQDNGLAKFSDTTGLSDLVEDFNPSWDGIEKSDIQFQLAACVAESILANRLRQLLSRHAATFLVENAVRESQDARILELPLGMPWKGVVGRMGMLDVAYAVFPVGGGKWFVDAMPPEDNPLGQRVPLPQEWAGLEHDALQAVSGVADAVFVHAGRFCASAGSREGALAMARRSLELASMPSVLP